VKVLLDENLPHTLRPRILGHDVYTVRYMRWNSIRNSSLLAKAAADKFDVLITMDAGFEYEQNLAALPLSVVILSARSNADIDLFPLVPAILNALDNLAANTIIRIG
jgi:hypothetical protein